MTCVNTSFTRKTTVSFGNGSVQTPCQNAIRKTPIDSRLPDGSVVFGWGPASPGIGVLCRAEPPCLAAYPLAKCLQNYPTLTAYFIPHPPCTGINDHQKTWGCSNKLPHLEVSQELSIGR